MNLVRGGVVLRTEKRDFKKPPCFSKTKTKTWASFRVSKERERERERENNNNNNKTRHRYHQYHAFVKVYVMRGVPFPCRGLNWNCLGYPPVCSILSLEFPHIAPRIYILPHLRLLLLFKSQHTMYVEEVCIDGFKSYAQRTIVPQFDQYFNAITGLNGSGKSNILDSICFVLGITNLSQVLLLHAKGGFVPVASIFCRLSCVLSRSGTRGY